MEPHDVDDLEPLEPERPGRDVLEYLEFPLRYPRAFWIPFLLIFTLGVLAVLGMPRKYRSSTQILVEHNDLPDYFVTPVSSEGMSQSLHTIREVVMSRTNLEQVIEELDPYPEAAGTPPYLVVESMRRAIAIGVRGRDSFSIEYVNRNPYKAMMVTNMLATRFIEDAAHIRDKLTSRAYAFVESNLEEARLALEEREKALREHRQRYRGALPEQLESNLGVLQQLQVEQQTLAVSLQSMEARRAGLERSLLEGSRAGGGDLGPAADLARLKAQLTGLRNRYTPQHPDVVSLQLQIGRLEAQMASGTASTTPVTRETKPTYDSLRLVEREIETVRARQEALDEKIAVYQRRIETTPEAEQQLAALFRDYEQLRDNYNAALKKQLEAESARKMEAYWKSGYFRVLDTAHLPRRPVRPYAAVLMFLGLAGGLGAGIVSVFVFDLLDRSVKTEREVEELLPYPLLVTLPRAESKTLARRPG